jgi:Cu(I)/Ag(I) efflux system membrane fusion protein
MDTLPKVNEMSETYQADEAFKDQLSDVFSSYLPLKDALIEGNVTTANKAAKTLLESLEEVDMSLVKGEAHMEWMNDLNVLKTASQAIAREDNLDRIRLMLSPLSDQLYHTLKKYQVEVDGYRQYCPMAKENTGAFWLSDSDEVLNPYFGEAMLTCGTVEETL